MNDCKISVVTVYLNAKESIKATIESVLEQTYEKFEYIVIDGKSEDGTLNILSEYENIFRRRNLTLTIISEKDHGIYNAMNKAIYLCKGNWIHYLNAGDTFASKGVLEKIGSECVNGNEEGVLYGDYYKKRKDEIVLCKAYHLKELTDRMCFCHQAAFTPRNLLEEQKFDEKYKIVADHKLFLKLYLSGIQFRYIPIPVAVFDCYGISQKNEIRLMKEEYRLKVECGVISKEKKNAGLWKCRVNCMRKSIQKLKQQFK